MPLSSTVSGSREPQPPQPPMDPSKEGSAANKVVSVGAGFIRTVGFENPKTQKQLPASSFTFNPPETFSLLAAVRKYDAENPNKDEAASRSPSPPEVDENKERDKRLYQAVFSDKIDDVRELVKQKNVNLLQVDQLGRTLLYLAIIKRNEQIINLLLTAEPKLLNLSSTSIGRTPLHLAAVEGLDYIVLSLLEFKPDLDATDVRGNTALHLASAKGDVTIYDKLLRAGANTQIFNKNGELANHPGSRSLPIPVTNTSCEEEIFPMSFPEEERDN